MIKKCRRAKFSFSLLKLRCDERFTHAFTACTCIFKEITLVGSNQGNYFQNATGCNKRTLKTTVATQLKRKMNFYKDLHSFNYTVIFEEIKKQTIIIKYYN